MNDNQPQTHSIICCSLAKPLHHNKLNIPTVNGDSPSQSEFQMMLQRNLYNLIQLLRPLPRPFGIHHFSKHRFPAHEKLYLALNVLILKNSITSQTTWLSAPSELCQFFASADKRNIKEELILYVSI